MTGFNDGPRVYRHQTVWLKDDDRAGNPAFRVAKIEDHDERGMPVRNLDTKLTLRHINSITGELAGWLISCTVADVLTSPPDTPHTRATGDIHIEVVHMRDPDGYDDPTFYLNGQPVGEWSNVKVTFYGIDCGAGRDFHDLVDAARSDKAQASPRVWAELAQYYAEPAGSKYIEGLPDEWPKGPDGEADDDWIAHLDEPDGPDGYSPYWAKVWDVDEEDDEENDDDDN